MTDDEMTTIEAEVVETVENLPAVREPATLFRTDDPAEVVQKAIATATALMDAVKQHDAGKPDNAKLLSTISGRQFPKVECWTLLGSMLGVFAVIEWTRELDDGWEARAVAKTTHGVEVGSAEAECRRSESAWKNRDSYAIRSMAQTRAVSKALRAPLGFVAKLAGLDPTPAEEMPSEAAREAPEPVRREGPHPYPIPTSWPKLEAAVKQCDNPDEAWELWQAFLRAATYHLYGKTSLKEITTDERKIMLQKAATVVCSLHDTDAGRDGPFQYFGETEQRAGWYRVLNHRLELDDDYRPPEPPVPGSAQEEIERLAAEF